MKNKPLGAYCCYLVLLLGDPRCVSIAILLEERWRYRRRLTSMIFVRSCDKLLSPQGIRHPRDLHKPEEIVQPVRHLADMFMSLHERN